MALSMIATARLIVGICHASADCRNPPRTACGAAAPNTRNPTRARRSVHCRGSTFFHFALCIILIGVFLATPISTALAEDTLKVATGDRGAWEVAAPELGQRAGIFRKHGISLELLYTDGDDEAFQAAMAGKVDLVLGISPTQVLRAYIRGVPARIIGANLTGAPNYWYVLKTSPIQTIKDLVGKTIAYASNGAPSHYGALDFIKEYRLNARLIPTGAAAPTFRALTAKDVDVAWAAPPFGIDEIDRGEIRIIAHANEVSAVRGKTTGVLATNGATLERRREALVRFMQAYRQTIDWMYSDPAALKEYAAFAGMSDNLARRLRDEFFTKDMLSPEKVMGLRATMKEARAFLSRRQVRELVQVPTRDSAGWLSWRRWLAH